MEVQRLKASIREETGKNPARRLRSSGLTPAVLYGSKTPSIKLTVQAAELRRDAPYEGEQEILSPRPRT
jgi:large subunit ribosomal protein L25